MTHAQEPLHFVAFVMNTASHVNHGQWRYPGGDQIRFNELDFWVDLAKRLDVGGFDAMFFADVVGLYGDYQGSWDLHAELGLQIPSNDPAVIMSALASHTKHLGLAFTAAPIQQPPFNFARQIATLDHASGGRIAWNIVSGLNGWKNFNHAEQLPHDDRYAFLEEYVDVLYKLWEGSWDEGALLQDRETGRHADPSKIHKINHASTNYSVEGPFLVAPSPQRTPLLFQAGSSPAGRRFAARHAEAQFIQSPDPESARALIEDTRRLAVEQGRHGHDLRFFQGQTYVVGSTEEEAIRTSRELDERIDIDGQIAHFGGAMGIDLGEYERDTPIEQVHVQGLQSHLIWLREYTGGRTPTLEDYLRFTLEQSRTVGTPEQIADTLAEWRDAGVSGINVTNATIPGTYVDFIDHVMPVLRERGLARTEPVEGTFRKKLFGTDRLSDRHPAARYRGAFAPQPAIAG